MLLVFIVPSERSVAELRRVHRIPRNISNGMVQVTYTACTENFERMVCVG